MTTDIFVEYESFHFSLTNIAHEDLTAGVPARKVGSLSLSIDSSFKRKGRPSLFYLGSEVHSSPALNFVTVWFNALKNSTDERASHSGGASFPQYHLQKVCPVPHLPAPTQKALYLPKRNGTVVGVVAIEDVGRIDVLQLDVLRVQPHVWIPQGYPEPCQTQIVILRPDQRQIYNTTVVAGR